MIKFYNEKGIEIRDLSFGRVRIGESAQMVLSVKNEGRFLLIDLNFSVDNPEVGILSCPKTLRPGESKELRIEWRAGVNSEFGLNCNISWQGDELRGEA